jgi:hypothetical protein
VSNGNNSTSSYTFTIPSGTLSVGTDSLRGSYDGDAVYAPSSNTANVTVTAAAALTPTVNVNPAATTLSSNQSLSVAVTVVGNGTITPTRTVTLSSGTYNSGAQTLVAGAYTFNIPANSLTAGTDTLTVVYSGDANYSSVTNSAVSVKVTQPTFTLNQPAIVIAPSTAIAPGSSATATITVAAVGGYTGSVTLSCVQTSTTASGGDSTTCTGGGTASAVTLSTTATTGTVTFSIGTTAKAAALTYPNLNGKARTTELAGLGGGAIVAFLVFLGIPARRRSWRQMLGLLILIAALGGLSSCGSGGSSGGGGGTSDPGTTAGTYTYTVTATGTPTVTPAVSTTFTVVVN